MDGHTPRQAYAQEKAELEQKVLDMVARADAMVAKAVDALSSLEVDKAHDAMLADDEIDKLDLEIEERCLRMLALQQPIGSDLREVGTVLKIITDIERIGDLAVDIAKIALKIDAEMGRIDYVDLRPMAEVSRTMLREAIQAFVRRDTSILPHVAKLEDEADRYYRDIRSQIHDFMREEPGQVVAASWLLLAIHHIERVADHALNISERVEFMVTGNLRSHRNEDAQPLSGEEG